MEIYKAKNEVTKIKYGLIIAGLIFLSAVLEIVRIRLPFLPSFMTIDFSSGALLLIAIAFGLPIGILAVIIKNILHLGMFFAMNNSVYWASELSSLITDLIFVAVGFAFYYIIAGEVQIYRETIDIRVRSVFLSGIISSVITALILLPIMNYLIYPLLTKTLSTPENQFNILTMYMQSLPSITSIWKGLFVFNLPWGIGKLIGSTILTTIGYALISSKDN